MTFRRRTAALTGTTATLGAVALLVTAGPVSAQPGHSAPAGQGMERMHQLMEEGNPGMTRMHELMQEGNPGMARMHQRMMSAAATETPSR